MREDLVIAVLAAAGFALAAYIFVKKSRGERLVCLIGTDCNKVVQSPYAVTFGLRNEVVGMWYYGVLAVSRLALFSFQLDPSALLGSVFSVATGLAALFSIYLVFVQLAILRELCEWCLGSTLISLAIFLLVIT